MTTDRTDGSRRRRYAVRFVVSIAIGVALTWMLVRGGLPIVPGTNSFEGLQPWAVPVYVLSLLGVHWFRAARWRHLLRPLGQTSTRAVLGVCWISFAAILFLPLRTGEVVRPYLITKRSKIRGWEALGTVGAERIIDGLVLSVVLFAGLALTTPLDPLPDHIGDLHIPVAAVPGAAYTALVLFAGCFAVMLLFYAKRELALRITRRTVGLLSTRLAERLAGVVERVAKGLSFLPTRGALAPFLAETACYWGLNAAGLWLLAQGCGLDAIGLGEACVVMGCIGIGILVPGAPGYFGTFQLSVYLALAMFVTPALVTGPGSAFVFLVYSCQIAQHVLGAAVGALLHRPPRADRHR